MMTNNSVFIREVGPREGFQSYQDFIPTSKKLELIIALAQTGLQEIQVTSFVNPKKVPQLKDADDLCKLLEEESQKGTIPDDVHFSGLYLNPKGYLRVLEHFILSPDASIHVSANEEFLKANMNLSLEKQRKSLDKWFDVFGDAELMELMVSYAFAEDVESYYDQIIAPFEEHEGLTIFLADTNGVATPSAIKQSINYLKSRFPGFMRIGLHLHHGKNINAMDNVLAGIDNGVAIYDSSVMGVGGCPFSPDKTRGNVATEKLIELCERVGLETGIDAKKYSEALKIAQSIFGIV